MTREHTTRLMLIIGSHRPVSMPNTDSSITVGLPALGAGFNLDGVMIGLITAAYIISAAIFILPFGRFSGSIGRKRTILSGLPFSLSLVLKGLLRPLYIAKRS